MLKAFQTLQHISILKKHPSYHLPFNLLLEREVCTWLAYTGLSLLIDSVNWIPQGSILSSTQLIHISAIFCFLVLTFLTVILRSLSFTLRVQYLIWPQIVQEDPNRSFSSEHSSNACQIRIYTLSIPMGH